MYVNGLARRYQCMSISQMLPVCVNKLPDVASVCEGNHTLPVYVKETLLVYLETLPVYVKEDRRYQCM